MDKSFTLSLAYIEKHPRSAARALAAIDPVDAAGFLDVIPARYGVMALSEIASWPSALILARMETDAASALLRELSYLDAAAILRLVASDRQEALLDALPAKLGAQLRNSLSFPSDTVGAHMTPEVISLQGSNTVGDAVNLVRRAAKDSSLQILIIDDDHKLRGVVDLAELMRRPENCMLEEIKRPAPAALSSRARLESVRHLSAWDDMIHLPVISRKKHLIGALSRKAVFREEHSVGADPSRDSIAGSLIEEFLAAGAGLGRVLFEVDSRASEAEEVEA